MRRLSLGASLALANALLVLLTVVALAATGALLVRRLVAEQARARVDAAAAAAVREVAAAGEQLATTARLLAERPTLQRHLRLGEVAPLGAFLERFRHTGQLSGAALFLDGKPYAVAGEVRWAELALPAGLALPAAPGTVVATEPGRPELVQLAVAPVGGGAEAAIVVVVRRLDHAVETAISGEVGLPVVLRAGVAPPAAPVPFEAIAPLGAGASGVAVAVLPAAPLDASLRRLVAGWAFAGLLTATVALAAGLLLGRRLGGPASRLGEAARRLGSGDLHQSVPREEGVEMGRLAATLEEMRRRLLALTSELERREAASRAVLEGIVEGVLAVDEARRVTYLNPQAAKLLGIAQTAAVGRFCGDLLRPEPDGAGEPPCRERCPIVHARGRGDSRALERLRPSGAGARSVVVSSSPPAGGSQVVVLRDETEEEAGRRVRDAILANLSHELKTPLAAQLAAVELLRDGLGEPIAPESARQLVGTLERSTLRLLGLVENLLASVRLETGEWPMRRESLDLAQVCREAADVLEPLFAQRRQHVVWKLASTLPVEGDHTQLLQVVLNLLGNANKFAPDGSDVVVSLRAVPGGLELAVEDQGPGLPPGDAGLIFDRFRRGGGPEPGHGPRGTGLGLSIVKTVVERHGGIVAAETGATGGARLLVTLPSGEASTV